MMACQCAFVCLVLRQEELTREKREREQVEQEKDAAIADLQHKLDNMETDYEKILHVSCNTGQFNLKLIHTDLKAGLMKQPVTCTVNLHVHLRMNLLHHVEPFRL